MKDRSVYFKLMCLVAVSVLTFIGMGLFSIYNTRSTFIWVKDVSETVEDFQKGTLEITNPLNELRQLSLSIVMAPNPQQQEQLKEEQSAKTSQLDKTFNDWGQRISNPQEHAVFDRLVASWNQYKKLKDVTIQKVDKGYREEAFSNATDEERKQFDIVTSELAEWMQVKKTNADAVYQAATSRYDHVLWISSIVALLTTLLVAAIGFLTTRSIIRPITILKAAAGRVAAGESEPTSDGLLPLTQRHDELGEMARAFSNMVHTLNTTIHTEKESRARIDTLLDTEKEHRQQIEKLLESIREAVGRLSTTSAQLLATTAQQASGAQEQAAAVAQTVTTVDEVTQTAGQAAQRAKEVGDTVQRTLEIGNSGRRAMEDSIVAMEKVKEQVEATAENILTLAEQAQAIGDIISTVNDIAEQTNLLALNAAIEASRAGEHGKGFSVVASEVKTLADQSKKATGQVRQILGEIQKATNSAVLSTEEVTRGVAGAIQVGNQSGQTIKTLAETLSGAAHAMAQIVASAGQQATGMIQINQGMKNIDQVARQSLAATHEAEMAAQNLNALGEQLTQLSAE